jgi:hypothetical protein
MTQTKMQRPVKFEIVREKFLKPEERFLLDFLKGFDRKTNQEWKDQGLWDRY